MVEIRFVGLLFILFNSCLKQLIMSTEYILICHVENCGTEIQLRTFTHINIHQVSHFKLNYFICQ